MIFGIGIDIVNIERIEQLMARWGDLFLGRVYTEREISGVNRGPVPQNVLPSGSQQRKPF